MGEMDVYRDELTATRTRLEVLEKALEARPEPRRLLQIWLVPSFLIAGLCAILVQREVDHARRIAGLEAELLGADAERREAEERARHAVDMVAQALRWHERSAAPSLAGEVWDGGAPAGAPSYLSEAEDWEGIAYFFSDEPATVVVDGRRVADTTPTRLILAAGDHEVAFVHGQAVERRRIVVTAGTVTPAYASFRR